MHFRVHFQYRITQVGDELYPVMYPIHALHHSIVQLCETSELFGFRKADFADDHRCQRPDYQRFLPTLPKLSEEHLQRNMFLTYLKSDILCRQVVQLNQHHVL